MIIVSYELRLGEFSGPLDKLLELIESEKMDVSRLSMAKVTDDFLKHVETLGEAPPALLADFIVIASQLILLKSKSLLPDLPMTMEDEENLVELEERLKAYREFKEAGRLVAQLWRSEEKESSRPYFLSISRNLPQDVSHNTFYPGETLALENLIPHMERLTQSLQKIILEEEVMRSVIVTLEEKMQHILERLHRIEETTFSKLSKSGDRSDVIVAFLAILHLAREQTIIIEQAEHFSDIIIKPNESTA
ncbi:MAG: segregation/condensation protein A [Patescibacteria group bacterium]